MVYYCGTNLGRGAKKDGTGLFDFLQKAVARAGLAPILKAHAGEAGAVRVDVLEEGGKARFVTIVNRADREQKLKINALAGTWKDLMSGQSWKLDGQPLTLPARFAGMLCGS